MWNSCYTEYFYMSNGVKQGSVLSAILFTIYIDRLLILLRDSGVGCKIDNCYTGAISYADDNDNDYDNEMILLRHKNIKIML